jgi:Spy/CpxP family protein refolding chaperone
MIPPKKTPWRGNMKPSKRLTMALVLVIVLVGVFAATAGVFPGHNRRGAWGFRVPGLKTLIELNLSDSQESQILNILEKYQRERQDTLDSLLKTRKHLSTVIHAEGFNEGDVRRAYQQVSSIEEELFVLRAKMMGELRAVLNPEQIELLRERRAQRTEKMRGRLETWLQNPGE